MTGALEETLPAWAERWRHPKLAIAVERSGGLDAVDVTAAVLDGLARPVSSPAAAIRRLVTDGEFRAATGLCRDPEVMASVDTEDHERLQAEIFDGEQAATAQLERRRNELRQRALRAEVDVPEPEGLETALHSRTEMEELFTRWTNAIDTKETERSQEIREAMRARQVDNPDSAPGWMAAIEGCIDAGELGTALEILRAGPNDFEATAPAAVRSGTPWPWLHISIAELLQWYADPSLARTGFKTRWWRRRDEDPTAHAALDALRALRETLNETTVRHFVTALHAVLDVDGMVHPVQAVEQGYQSELRGLGDPRLPPSLLPTSLTLWFGPPGWSPPEQPGPAVLFRTGVDRTEAQAGVAVMTPQLVFELIAPDSGRNRTAGTRRVQLLRDLCRQFDLDHLIGPDPALYFDSPSAFRSGVGWLLDLLGVRAGGVTLDTLLFDTARHPVLLQAALNYLVGPRADRPEQITTHDLARWRSERAPAQDLCTRLRADLDPQAEAVLAAAVLTGRDFGDLPVAAEELADRLREVFSAMAEDYTPRPAVEELIDVPSVLHRLATSGLVIPSQSGYKLCSPALLALLIGGDDWDAVALDRLKLLSARVDAVLESVRIELSRQAVVHWIKNEIEALELNVFGNIAPHADELPPSLREPWSLLLQSLERLDGAREASSDDIRERLRVERVDLVQLLTEIVATERQYRRYADITLDAEPGDFVAEVSRFSLDLALRDLITNAVQQFDKERPGRVRIRLLRQHHNNRVLIEIEDSGHGLTAEQRSQFEAGTAFTSRSGGEGKGLRYARAHIDHCGGSLTLGPDGGGLGGARFMIQMSLLATA